MISVELKVNGALIGHIYGRNIFPLPNGKHMYEYEYYEPESRVIRKGTVEHKRENGLRSLVSIILDDIAEL